MNTPSITCDECNGKGIDPGSLYEPEPCLHCGGTGRELLEIGTVIEYRDDDSDARITATVLDHVGNGWLEVATDGVDDTPWISPELVLSVIPWDEYLNRKPAVSAASNQERKVA